MRADRASVKVGPGPYFLSVRPFSSPGAKCRKILLGTFSPVK